jgi:hypothetical protein
MKPFEEFSEEEIIKEVNRSLFPTCGAAAQFFRK